MKIFERFLQRRRNYLSTATTVRSVDQFRFESGLSMRTQPQGYLAESKIARICTSITRINSPGNLQSNTGWKIYRKRKISTHVPRFCSFSVVSIDNHVCFNCVSGSLDVARLRRFEASDITKAECDRHCDLF